MDDAELTQKLRRLLEARDALAEATAAKTEAEKNFREIEGEVWEYIDESDFDRSIPRVIPGYGRVLFTQKETSYGKAIDKKALSEWAKENDLYEEIFSEPTTSARKLNEIAREARDNADALPPGMDANTRQYVQVTMRDKSKDDASSF